MTPEELDALCERLSAPFVRGADNCRDALAAIKALRERVARLEAALEEIDRILTVPAAEYVPAIPDAWAVIKRARAAIRGEQQ